MTTTYHPLPVSLRELRAQRILIIDTHAPMYDRNSGHVRLNQMIDILLKDGHAITFLSRYVMSEAMKHYGHALEAKGITFIDGDPERCSNDYYSLLHERRDLKALFENNRFDVVLLCAHGIAQDYLPIIQRWSHRSRIVIDTVDVAFIRLEREANCGGDAKAQENARKTKERELKCYEQADELIAITPVEAELLSEHFPNTPISVVPNIHEITPTVSPFAPRSGLLFVANFWHHANEPGIRWFCDNVWPLIRAREPQMKLTVIGQTPPEWLLGLQNEGITALGWVEHLEPYLQRARVSIAPLTFGAGMKGKVGEALAAGLPVVTTTTGAEGMSIEDGIHASVTDDPAAFADAVCEIYHDEGCWVTRSRNGQALIQQHFTNAFARASLRRIIPPSQRSTLRYVAVCSAEDETRLVHTVRQYVEHYARPTPTRVTLDLYVDPVRLEQFGALLTNALSSMGIDLSTIPDINVYPAVDDFAKLIAPDAIWIPSHDALRPTYVQLDDAILTQPPITV